MTNDELKYALLSQEPVWATLPSGETLHFERVTAIIYKLKEGKICVCAECLEKHDKWNRVTVIGAERIESERTKNVE